MLYIALYLLLFAALAAWGRSIAIGIQRTERRPGHFQSPIPTPDE